MRSAMDDVAVRCYALAYNPPVDGVLEHRLRPHGPLHTSAYGPS